jgi:hypothetical protein
VAGQYHGKETKMSNAKATIKVFTPLEVQPEVIENTDGLWLWWQDDAIIKDNFGWYVEDNALMVPFGTTYTDGRADTLRLNVDSTEVVVPFFVTSAKVVCQDGVWGWMTEAKEAQL